MGVNHRIGSTQSLTDDKLLCYTANTFTIYMRQFFNPISTELALLPCVSNHVTCISNTHGYLQRVLCFWNHYLDPHWDPHCGYLDPCGSQPMGILRVEIQVPTEIPGSLFSLNKVNRGSYHKIHGSLPTGIDHMRSQTRTLAGLGPAGPAPVGKLPTGYGCTHGCTHKSRVNGHTHGFWVHP